MLEFWSQEALLAVDAGGRVTACAGRAEELFGRELLGGDLGEMAQGMEPVVDLVARLARAGGSGSLHDLLVRVGDARCRLQVRGQSMEEPGLVALSLWADGPTEDADAQERVQRRGDLMHHLAAGLAHEIRNPLGAMRGAAQLLGRKSREGDDGEAEALADLIVEEADRVEALVAELMEVGRPSAMELGPVDLSVLSHRAFRRVEAQGRDAKLSLSLDLDPSLPPVEGDERYLARMLDNLLANALHWTPIGGIIRLRTRLELGDRLMQDGVDRGRVLRVDIEDSGPGVPPGERRRIFDPLVSTRSDGTGLGLYTVLRVVEEHGGVVDVEDSELGGALFRVRLRERGAQLRPALPQGET